MDAELKALIESNAAETRQHFDTVADVLRGEIATNNATLRNEITADNREHVDAVAKTLRTEIQASTAENRQHVDGVAETLRQEIASNAAETHRLFDEAWRHADAVAVETRLHFDVVADGLRNVIQFVGEATVANSHRIAEYATRLDSLGARSELLEVAVSGVAAKVDGLDAKVDGLDSKVGTLSSKVDHLTMRVDHLEVEMKDGFAELHARVDRLESDLSPQ